MELRNNNRRIIGIYAREYNRRHKQKNRMLIGAAALTVALVFSVLSLAAGQLDAHYLTETRMWGSATDLSVHDATQEQYEAIKKLPHIKKIGKEWEFAAGFVNDIGAYTCVYVDDIAYKNIYTPAYGKITGTYPRKEREVMLSARTLAKMKIKEPEAGMAVTLQLKKSDGKTAAQRFYLSGYYTDYTQPYRERESTAFFSKDYVFGQGVSITKPSRLLIQKSLFLKDTNISGKIAAAAGIDPDNMDESNLTGLIYSETRGASIGAGIFAAVVLLCAYFLIWNTINHPLNRENDHYELLSAIGATQRQKRRITRRQVMRVSWIGIAIGAAVGCGGVLLLLPVLMEKMYLYNFGSSPLGIGFRPLLLAAAAVLTELVVIACAAGPASREKAPSRFQSVDKNVQVKPGGGIRRLAFRYGFSGGKRSALTVLSLTIVFTVGLSALVVARGLDTTGTDTIESDFEITSMDLPYGSGYTDDFSPFDQRLAEKIAAVPGITNTSTEYGSFAKLDADEQIWRPFLTAAGKLDSMQKNAEDKEKARDWRSEFLAGIVLLNEKNLQALKAYGQGKKLDVDFEGLEAGTSAIVTHVYSFDGKTKTAAKQAVGRQMTFLKLDGQKLGNLRFGGYLNKNRKGFPQLPTIIHTAGQPIIVMSSKGFKRLGLEAKIQAMNIDVKPAWEAKAHVALRPLIDQRNEQISRQYGDTFCGTYLDYLRNKDFKVASMNYQLSLEVFLYGIAVLLLLLGLLNYFNVLVTNYSARRREFAILEGVGMTAKQVRQMLLLGGIYYSAMVAGLLLTAGNGALFLVVKLVKSEAPWFRFSYPYGAMGLVILLLFIICVALSYAAYQRSMKDSIAKRLKL